MVFEGNIVIAQMSRCLKYSASIFLFVLIFAMDVQGQAPINIKWGVHDHSSAPSDFQRNFFASPAWTSLADVQEISELTLSGASSSFIPAADQNLIELGFFDTDNAANTENTSADQSSDYTPNTSSSTLFRGRWTPITNLTKIGYDYGGESIGDGLFWFNTRFAQDGSVNVNDNGDATESEVQINPGTSNQLLFDELDGDNSQSIGKNALWDRTKALVGASSDPYIGIRFYDAPSNSLVNGTTRYNTIMNTNWTFTDGELMYLQEPATGAEASGMDFEFKNSDYSTTRIGTDGSSTLGDHNNNYLATIAYYDGGSMDIRNSSAGDVIVSGMHKDSGGGEITVGDDNTLTINSTNGNTFDFSGDIWSASDGAGASSLIKTGDGEQILTGTVNLAGSSSGWADILEGTLTFNPDLGKTQSVEYVKNSSGTPTLKLDNTVIGSGQIVELGFANTTSAQTFSGGVTLGGSNGTSNKIKIASGATDYSKEQIFSGAITGGNTLVKDGAGRLVLTGDSTSSFTGNITVDDGTLVIGNGSGDGSNLDSDNTITINKGKLEIADNESVTLTAQGGTGKSIIGGKGTIAAATIGNGAGEIDYISPGRGITSSLTPSQKAVDYDASGSDSIGDFTVTSLTLNGGSVYDWQIDDFTGGAGNAGSKYDVLKFNSLSFESGQQVNINIMAIRDSNGTAGYPDNGANILNSYANTSGFLFLDSQSGSHATNGPTSAGDASSYFNIRSDDFSYNVGNWYGDWGVYYDGSGDFYLTYSAVPEPSTYVMVTGLFLLPGWRWIRRLRANGKESEKTEG